LSPTDYWNTILNSNQTVSDGVAHFKNPRKCAYHVTFDLDLYLEHTLDAGLPVDHRVQVWSRSGHLPGRRSDFRASTKVPVSRDLWPWPWPWAHPGCTLTWSPSCKSAIYYYYSAWKLILILPPTEGRSLSRLRWLVNITRWCTCPQTVTHPKINRAWRRVTSLIVTNALPLSQTTIPNYHTM